MSEQEKFLESHVVHFGLGTPSRILKLLQNGELLCFISLMLLKGRFQCKIIKCAAFKDGASIRYRA